MTATETPVVLSGGTKIEWAHFTFNPIWGCSRVSRACQHCYAEALAKRYGHDVWGKNGSRRTFGDKHWDEPLKWNRKAERDGVRYRVFCASMADVFEDHPIWPEQRERLWSLIEATPHLDWMLLTKRPENIADMLPLRWSGTNPLPPNVWVGCTAEDQECADQRLPHLMQVDAVVRFVSYEPAAGPLKFHPDDLRNLHLVIAGGETGHGAQPAHPDWFRAVRDQCVEAGVAFHFKQFGDWAPVGWSECRVSDRVIGLDGRCAEVASGNTPVGGVPMRRIGKKAAGRLLDGRTWDQMPERKAVTA